MSVKIVFLHQMKPYLTLFLLAVSFELCGQHCDSVLIKQSAEGREFSSFAEPVVVAGAGNLKLSFFARYESEEALLLLQVNGSTDCNITTSAVEFEFTSGYIIRMNNEVEKNCDFSFAFFAAKRSGTFHHLVIFRNLELAKIRLVDERYPLSFELNEESRAAIKTRMTCLAERMGFSAIDEQEDLTFTVVEDMPQFIGGQEAMYSFITSNVNSKGIGKGTVFVQFKVARDGAISNAKVLRTFSDKASEEAIRVISIMPKWRPGHQNGLPVNVNFVLPIKF